MLLAIFLAPSDYYNCHNNYNYHYDDDDDDAADAEDDEAQVWNSMYPIQNISQMLLVKFLGTYQFR